MTDKIVTFRVEQKLKYEFEKLANSLDLTSSQMLRAYMREIVEKNKNKKGGK